MRHFEIMHDNNFDILMKDEYSDDDLTKLRGDFNPKVESLWLKARSMTGSIDSKIIWGIAGAIKNLKSLHMKWSDHIPDKIFKTVEYIAGFEKLEELNLSFSIANFDINPILVGLTSKNKKLKKVDFAFQSGFKFILRDPTYLAKVLSEQTELKSVKLSFDKIPSQYLQGILNAIPSQKGLEEIKF
eukprot:CAMPEP_0114588640 /NCGR_PEP_ID=MMETSP0125-20121206/11291_1 /TAXON_ID=485358 ORGANISM="Aristerostoma sp., Strain ATCC 50986" /NCGR_SAMPLE_ID=MMETSP0125 /ASSEMBLY_ACC=CAM_ASM_000245 /LENGTH=185 /DNA_ID=CAMNT_0001785135 /DNA_START=1043 /DNA_END=1600 /DNA_ORIENTATION=-